MVSAIFQTFLISMAFCLVLSAETTNELPKEEYLKQWATELTPLNHIPKCQDVPELSEEEMKINKTCTNFTKSILCANIYLFGEVRYVCEPYTANVETFREAIETLVVDMGVEKFSDLTFKKVFERLEEMTKIKITHYIRRDIVDLVMSVIDDMLTEAGFSKQDGKSTSKAI